MEKFDRVEDLVEQMGRDVETGAPDPALTSALPRILRSPGILSVTHHRVRCEVCLRDDDRRHTPEPDEGGGVALDSDVKKQIMTEYATAESDTGSPEVQVAMLSRRISDLTEHLRSTSTTTTAGVACCCWSAGAAGC